MRILAMAAGCFGAILLAPSPASAATVNINGIVVNLCVLTPTGGTMVIDAGGTTMSSETGVGALPASLAVVATGSAPTLTFNAPSLTGPASGATTQIRYTGTSANQAYTATTSTASASLIDNFIIHARVQNPAGFPSGSYTVTTVVTCGQS